MKKIIMFCLVTSLVFSSTVYAEESQKQYFQVELNHETLQCLGPGDYRSETFYLYNGNAQSIDVRLCKVKNLQDSELYEVIVSKWMHTLNAPYGPFDALVTEWHTIPAGQTMKMDLGLYFPKEAGNQYQGESLSVEFTFACKNGTAEIWNGDGITAPQTGDPVNGYKYAILLVLAITLLFLLSASWRKRDEK